MLGFGHYWFEGKSETGFQSKGVLKHRITGCDSLPVITSVSLVDDRDI